MTETDRRTQGRERRRQQNVVVSVERRVAHRRQTEMQAFLWNRYGLNLRA